MDGIKANAQRRVKQDVEIVLKNMQLKILIQPHDEVLMTTDSRYINYKANEDRLILKDEMAYCSGNILEERVVSNITKSWPRSN